MSTIKDGHLLNDAFASVGLHLCPMWEVVPYDLQALLIGVSNGFNIFLKDAGLSHLPIRLAYVSDTSLNAAALKYKDCYYIAINAAVPFILNNTFYALFSDSKFLSWIGNASAETGKVVPKNPFPDYASVANISLRPRDAVRVFAAEALSNLFVEFIIYHELWHIVGGHLDYLNKKLGMSGIMEVAHERDSLLESSILQALELDADRDASLRLAKGIRDLQQQHNYPSWISTPINTAISLFVGAHVLTRMFGNVEPELPSWKSWSHPSSFVRRMRIDFWIGEELLSQEEKSDIAKYVLSEFSLVDTLFMALDNNGNMVLKNEERAQKMGFPFLKDADGYNFSMLSEIKNEVRKHSLLNK